MTGSPIGQKTESVPVGIGWMLAATFLFVCMDSTAKSLLEAGIPLAQVIWARYLFHALLVVAVLGPQVRRLVATRRLAMHGARSAALLATTLLFFGGLQFIPLVQATTIIFITPIVVTALSVPLLGEAVGWRRWAGVAVGFLGALIVIRPFGLVGAGGFMDLAILLPLAAVVTNALFHISTRVLGRTEDGLTTLFYTAALGTVVTSLAVPAFWEPVPLWAWGAFVLLGLFGGVSQYALFKAFEAAPAAVLAPFNYASLIWATLFGLVLFGDLPDVWTIVGAGVIVGSGLYIFHREQRRTPE